MTRAYLTTAALLSLCGFAAAQTPELVYPIIPKVGGVVAVPHAAEPPRTGAKVVFDVATDAKAADLNKGLERVARLLNLYGAAGLKPSEVKIALVVHGEATKCVLTETAYKARFGGVSNPNLAVIEALRKAGVEVFVCGQALAYKGFKTTDVADGVQVASAALTVVINKQMDGYAYVPAH